MYLTKIFVQSSSIEGKGVFAAEDIKKDDIVWKFNHAHDQSLSLDEFEKLGTDEKTELLRVAYLSPSSNRWIFPPEQDPARFTNHSETNNLSVIFDAAISEEPFFAANKDIQAGEELTVDYSEFDATPNKVNVWD